MVKLKWFHPLFTKERQLKRAQFTINGRRGLIDIDIDSTRYFNIPRPYHKHSKLSCDLWRVHVGLPPDSLVTSIIDLWHPTRSCQWCRWSSSWLPRRGQRSQLSPLALGPFPVLPGVVYVTSVIVKCLPMAIRPLVLLRHQVHCEKWESILECSSKFSDLFVIGRAPEKECAICGKYLRHSSYVRRLIEMGLPRSGCIYQCCVSGCNIPV